MTPDMPDPATAELAAQILGDRSTHERLRDLEAGDDLAHRARGDVIPRPPIAARAVRALGDVQRHTRQRATKLTFEVPIVPTDPLQHGDQLTSHIERGVVDTKHD